MALITDTYAFIHIFKTGGNSIRQMIDPSREGREVGGVHVEAKGLQQLVDKDAFDKLFKFSVVRNPYDWLFSTFLYIRYTNHNFKDKAGGSFEQFLTWYVTDAKKHNVNLVDANKYLTLTEFLYNDAGALLVNRVYKYEDIFDITRNGTVDGNLEFIERFNIKGILHINRNQHRPETYTLTPAECSIINQHFAKDFENFGYPMAKIITI